MERNKRNSSREVKSQIIPICRWYDLYLKDPKDSTTGKEAKKLPRFGNVEGYKISIQKSVAFLYSNDE
jgi:hypothetical protein